MKDIDIKDKLIGEGLCRDNEYQWYIYERQQPEAKRLFLLTIDGPISSALGDVPTNVWADKYPSIAQAMEIGMSWFPEEFLDK